MKDILSINEYKGKTYVMANLKDIKKQKKKPPNIRSRATRRTKPVHIPGRGEGPM